MKIGIICSDISWIYGQFVSSFESYGQFEYIRNPKVDCDVYHYIPYYEVPKIKHIGRPCSAWFSHQEIKDPIRSKFLSAGRAVDLAISHSKKYADLLRENGTAAIQILPGVNMDRFKMRSEKRPGNIEKLVVGYCGRLYTSTSRKNPVLLKQISELPWVDFRATDGKLELGKIPEFYANLDLCISPAVVEGGPMAIQEALAVGCPVLCFENVGVAQEFGLGVLKVPMDNKLFIKKMLEFKKSQKHFKYRNLEIMKKLRVQVVNYTWQKFVEEHENQWRILKESDNICKEGQL